MNLNQPIDIEFTIPNVFPKQFVRDVLCDYHARFCGFSMTVSDSPDTSYTLVCCKAETFEDLEEIQTFATYLSLCFADIHFDYL